jgi:hypothetical protein
MQHGTNVSIQEVVIVWFNQSVAGAMQLFGEEMSLEKGAKGGVALEKIRGVWPRAVFAAGPRALTHTWINNNNKTACAFCSFYVPVQAGSSLKTVPRETLRDVLCYSFTFLRPATPHVFILASILMRREGRPSFSGTAWWDCSLFQHTLHLIYNACFSIRICCSVFVIFFNQAKSTIYFLPLNNLFYVIQKLLYTIYQMKSIIPNH